MHETVKLEGNEFCRYKTFTQPKSFCFLPGAPKRCLLRSLFSFSLTGVFFGAPGIIEGEGDFLVQVHQKKRQFVARVSFLKTDIFLRHPVCRCRVLMKSFVGFEKKSFKLPV